MKKKQPDVHPVAFFNIGAASEVRTRDPQLGKLVFVLINLLINSVKCYNDNNLTLILTLFMKYLLLCHVL